MESKYYSNGQIESNILYKNGAIVDGEYNTYHENGNIKEVKRIVNDQYANGRHYIFHEDGSINITFGARNGKYHDTYHEIDSDGKEISLVCYRRGKNTGPGICTQMNGISNSNYDADQIWGRLQNNQEK